MSSIVNKVKDALHSDKSHEQPQGTSGPHSSRAANTADPRVDSDRDHRANPAGTTGTTGTHTGTTGSGLTGSHGTTGTTTGSGLTGSHGTTGTTGTHTGTTGSGLTGSHGTTGSSGLTGSNARTGYDDPTGTHGPHSSRAANAADPRVDSDRDGRGAHGTTGSGLTGSHGTTGTHTGTTGSGLTGSHGTTGSGLTGNTHGTSAGTSGISGQHHNVGNTHGATGGVSAGQSAAGHAGSAIGGTKGTGPAPNTAGPHKSDAMNKADPRVDSDLDGSKTVGGDKTYAQNSTGVAKDPTDAAQVPPSVLAKHVGEPEIAHDDHGHQRARRNSKVSAQELHRGL